MDQSLVEPETTFRHGWTAYQVYCSLSIIIGSSFMFGYNAVVVNEPEAIFKTFINDSYLKEHDKQIGDSEIDQLWTIAVSLFLVGGTIGGLIGSSEADKFGRRKALLLNCVIGVFSGILMFIAPFTHIFELLLIGRFIAGLHCGSISAIVPAYLTEIAPLSLRGASGTLNQLSIVLGGLLAAVLGLPEVLGRPDDSILWPFVFFPCVIFPFVQFFLLLGTVESPRWLMMKILDEPSTYKAVAKLRGGHVPHHIIDLEVAELRHEREIDDARPKMSFKEALVGALGWPLVICVMMQLAQQLTGINAVIYYSTSVFEKIGLKDPIPQYCSLAILFTTVIFTVISTFIVERAGRRMLMLLGMCGMWLSCIGLTVFMNIPGVVVLDYLTAGATFVFVAAFSLGPASIPWFIAPELTLPQYRSVVIAICTFANWVANLVIGFTFPPIDKAFGAYSFVPFMIMLIIFITFTFLFLPETKGTPPEESIHRLQMSKLQVCKPNDTQDYHFDTPNTN